MSRPGPGDLSHQQERLFLWGVKLCNLTVLNNDTYIFTHTKGETREPLTKNPSLKITELNQRKHEYNSIHD